ncbi:MAG: hypothetical protein AB7H48_12045 [Parachlamydiales bacterium]
MVEPLDIAIDHLHCYRNAVPFFPLVQDGNWPISDWAHAAVVFLQARPQDDLNWSSSLEMAREIVCSGKWVLWEIDFGFGSGSIDLNDQTAFYSYTVAIEEFVKKVWKEFSAATFGLVIYRGDADFSKRILNVADRFAEEGVGDGSSCRLDLYAAEMFAQYLHRLVSFLPDGLAPLALIDARGSNCLAQAALMFSRRRFEHVHLAVWGSPLPVPGLCWQTGGSFSGWIGPNSPIAAPASVPNRALCLPQDDFCTLEFFGELDELLENLLQSGDPFRLVCEERLTEEWDGLDQLILFPGQTSPQGKRMVQGFIAAGGSIIDAGTLRSASNTGSLQASSLL